MFHRAFELNLEVVFGRSACQEVRVTPSDGVSMEWSLTAEGIACAEVSSVLSSPTSALQVRSGISDDERTRFELMMMLQSGGWVCQVYVKPSRRASQKRKKSKGSSKHVVEAVPFEATGRKVFWVKPAQATLLDQYMLALLKAADGSISVPVKHFQPEAYYDAVLQGREYVKRPRKLQGTDDFAFFATDVPARPIVPQSRRSRKRPRLAKDPCWSDEDDSDDSCRSSSCHETTFFWKGFKFCPTKTTKSKMHRGFEVMRPSVNLWLFRFICFPFK